MVRYGALFGANKFSGQREARLGDEFDKQARQNVPYDQLGRLAQKGNIRITSI